MAVILDAKELMVALDVGEISLSESGVGEKDEILLVLRSLAQQREGPQVARDIRVSRRRPEEAIQKKYTMQRPASSRLSCLELTSDDSFMLLTAATVIMEITPGLDVPQLSKASTANDGNVMIWR